MEIDARDVWRSCWRAARVEYAALYQDCSFCGSQIPVGDRLMRCRQDSPMQKLAYHLVDVRTVTDMPGYQWITGNQYRFLRLQARSIAIPEEERIPF